MRQLKLAFLDLETTGGVPGRDKIIEIGIVRVENGEIKDSWQKIVDPGTYVPPEILNFTGITQEEIDRSPGFLAIKDELLAYLKGYIIVAHNARFDYGFLRREFKDAGISFKAKTLCSVKLSRRLFPQKTHHNLDAIIEEFKLECARRHRAYDDALATWQFFKYLMGTLPQDLLENEISILLAKPAVPVALPPNIAENLPEYAGVYIFYNKDGAALYIGKSKNLKERVMAHFTNDYLSSMDTKLARDVDSVEWVTTTGDLGACLLESKLVKEMQPLYNKRLRKKNELVIVTRAVTPEGYWSVEVSVSTQIYSDELGNILGIFRSKREVKDVLAEMAGTHGLCDKLLGLQSCKGACFGHVLERCKGACVEKEPKEKYNLRFIEAFAKRKIKPWPYKGRVLIREYNYETERARVHLVDKWCYLGEVEEGWEDVEEKRSPYRFDFDAYKILKRYLDNKHNWKYVTEI